MDIYTKSTEIFTKNIEFFTKNYLNFYQISFFTKDIEKNTKGAQCQSRCEQGHRTHIQIWNRLFVVEHQNKSGFESHNVQQSNKAKTKWPTNTITQNVSASQNLREPTATCATHLKYF